MVASDDKFVFLVQVLLKKLDEAKDRYDNPRFLADRDISIGDMRLINAVLVEFGEVFYSNAINRHVLNMKTGGKETIYFPYADVVRKGEH